MRWKRRSPPPSCFISVQISIIFCQNGHGTTSMPSPFRISCLRCRQSLCTWISRQERGFCDSRIMEPPAPSGFRAKILRIRCSFRFVESKESGATRIAGRLVPGSSLPKHPYFECYSLSHALQWGWMWEKRGFLFKGRKRHFVRQMSHSWTIGRRGSATGSLETTWSVWVPWKALGDFRGEAGPAETPLVLGAEAQILCLGMSRSL